MKKIVLLFCMVGFLTGCSLAKIDNLRQDNTFTYSSLTKKSVGFVDVTCSIKKLPLAAKLRFNQALQKAFHKHYPELKVTAPYKINAMLGDKSYQTILEFYRKNGSITLGQGKVLMQHLPQVRYLIFSRVTRVVVNHSVSKDSDVQTYLPKDRDGDYPTVVTYSYDSDLTLGLEVKVYDIALQKFVWQGYQERVDTNSNQESENGIDSSDNGVLTGAVDDTVSGFFDDMLTSDKDSRYPVSPTGEKLVKNIFDVMLYHFPSGPIDQNKSKLKKYLDETGLM